MKVRMLMACCAVGVFFSLLGQATAGDMRTGVRFTYLQSIQDITDWHDDNINNSEMDASIPAALSVSPAYEFDCGLLLWAEFGPAFLIIGDIEYWSVPVGAGVGFSFLPHANISPYVKTGVRYPIAGGDYVDSSSAGLVVATGVEFFKQRMVGLVVEVGYDASKVSFGDSGYYDWHTGHHYSYTEDIKGGLTASVGAVF